MLFFALRNKTIGNMRVFDHTCFRLPSDKSVIVPEGVEILEQKTFCGCDELKSLTLPMSLRCLMPYSIAYCSGLKSLVVPQNVECLESGIIGCTGLESLRMHKANPRFDSRYDCNAIIDSENLKLVTGCYVSKIPDDVTTIGYESFAECSNIESVLIPDGVTDIEPLAFFKCYSLREINIPDKVESIGYHTFAGCRSLKFVELPASVERIGMGAFYAAGIETLLVPKGMKDKFVEMGLNEFRDNIVERI